MNGQPVGRQVTLGSVTPDAGCAAPMQIHPALSLSLWSQPVDTLGIWFILVLIVALAVMQERHERARMKEEVKRRIQGR